MSIKNFQIEILLFILLTIIFSINFKYGFFWIGGDNVPIFLYKEYILDQMYSWTSSTGLGGVSFSSIYFFYIPLYTGIKFLETFLNLEIINIVYNYINFIILPFSIYYLFSFFSKNKPIILLITLFFSFHTLTYISISRNIINITLLFILTPLIIRFLYNSIENNISKLDLLILLFLILLNPIVLSNPWTALIQIITVLLFLLIYIFRFRNFNINILKKVILFLILIYWHIFTFISINYIFIKNNDAIIQDNWNNNILINNRIDFVYNSIRGVSTDFFNSWGNINNNIFYPVSNNNIYKDNLFVFISFIPTIFIIFLILSNKNYTKSNFILLISFLMLITGISNNSSISLENSFISDNFVSNVFRNPQQKFSILFLLIYSLLILDYLDFIKKKNNIFYLISYIFISAYILVTSSNYWNGQFIPKNNLVASKDISSKYEDSINYINSNNSIKRIYLMPSLYSTWTNTDFNYEGYHLFHYGLSNKRVFNINDIAFSKYNNLFIDLIQNKVIDKDKNIYLGMKQLNIDTIVYDKNINREKRFSYVEEHDKNIEFLNSIDQLYLDKVFDNIYIYNLKDSVKPDIYTQNNKFKRINPTKYKVNISNVKTDQDIQFLDSFHSQWNLYLNPIKSNSKDCNVIQEYNNEGKNIKECEHTQKFFEGEELSYLWKQPVFEDSHKLVYDYANQWTIDPEYIKANFDKSYYKENPDGSIDIELTLYFKPQSYFYLGIIISGTTLILCLSYLGYAFYCKRGVKGQSTPGTPCHPRLLPRRIKKRGKKGQE